MNVGLPMNSVRLPKRTFHIDHYTNDIFADVACASSDRRRAALDLRSVHDAACRGVERVAPMHGTAVIPQHQIADPPDVLPGELRVRHEIPQLVEQSLGLGKFEPHEIGVASAAEVEHAPPGFWMRANQGVYSTRGRSRVVCCGDALAQIAAAVVGTVVLDL